MKRFVLFAILVAAVIVVVLVSTLAGGRPQLPPPSSPPPAPVTLDAAPGDVKAFVIALINDKTRSLPMPFDQMSPHSFGDASFPPDYQIAAASKQDPALEAYARIAAANRANDIYLFDSLLKNWESEYQLNGRPLLFHCNFILRLAPAGNGATELSVLEYQPQVNRGSRFVILGKEGPGTYDDIVNVPPTNKDRSVLLDFIASEWKKSRGR